MIGPVALQRMIDAWPDPAPSEDEGAARLTSALDAAATGGCGPADLAVLIRDALRHWQEAEGHDSLPAPLNVPTTPPWPTRQQWSAAGITAVPGRDDGRLRLTAVLPWRPAWLPFHEPVDAFPASRRPRIAGRPEPADPVWSYATGLDEYRSFEQREAVRTLVTSPADGTVLVVLATGSGKSLVGLLDALVRGPVATTIVVVPTTSLAIDQEEQLRLALRRQDAPDAEQTFAWYSGRNDQVAIEMLSRIRQGGQRVVFASPEALFGTLGDVLADAAAAGRVGQFVVDEAHMVATWGTDFRPDFQALGGFRRRLRDAAAAAGHRFRTVLMSATITTADIETLSDLFADGGPLIVAGAPSLRPEIGYLTAEAADSEERLERVCEAALHLPRPVFVYASTREGVRELVDAFSAQGFQRVVSVTGRSTDEQRRSAVAALRGDQADCRPTADLAVGTSAFGLGIDVPDVRAVVHACLPETLDRYYQEVGRSARDGLAALALLLWTADDLQVARSLSEKRVIGVSLARERWAAMLRVVQQDESTMWVPLRALRIGLDDDSDENEKWNSRTLASMVRAGFVRLAGSRRDHATGPSIGVVSLRGDLDTNEAWNVFEAMRQMVRRRAEASLQAVLRLARDGRVCDALLPVYTVQNPARMSADLVVHDTCGGCAACSPPRPEPVAPLSVERPPLTLRVTPGASALLDHDGCAYAVAEPDRRWERDIGRLVGAAVDVGIRQVVVDGVVAQARPMHRALRDAVLRHGLAAPLLTVLADSPDGSVDLDVLPDVPALLILRADDARSDLRVILAALPRPVIAVVGAGQPSLLRDDLTIRQMYPGTPDLQTMIDLLLACRT